MESAAQEVFHTYNAKTLTPAQQRFAESNLVNTGPEKYACVQGCSSYKMCKTNGLGVFSNVEDVDIKEAIKINGARGMCPNGAVVLKLNMGAPLVKLPTFGGWGKHDDKRLDGKTTKPLTAVDRWGISGEVDLSIVFPVDDVEHGAAPYLIFGYGNNVGKQWRKKRKQKRSLVVAVKEGFFDKKTLEWMLHQMSLSIGYVCNHDDLADGGWFTTDQAAPGEAYLESLLPWLKLSDSTFKEEDEASKGVKTIGGKGLVWLMKKLSSFVSKTINKSPPLKALSNFLVKGHETNATKILKNNGKWHKHAGILGYSFFHGDHCTGTMDAGQFATKFVPVVGGIAGVAVAGVDMFDDKTSGMHNSNVARSMGTNLPTAKGIFLEVYRGTHVDAVIKQELFRSVNRIDDNSNYNNTEFLPKVFWFLNNILPSTFATIDYRAGARLDPFRKQATFKAPYVCTDRAKGSGYEEKLQLGELCPFGNAARCISGTCQPVVTWGALGAQFGAGRSVCTTKDFQKSVARNSHTSIESINLVHNGVFEGEMDVGYCNHEWAYQPLGSSYKKNPDCNAIGSFHKYKDYEVSCKSSDKCFCSKPKSKCSEWNPNTSYKTERSTREEPKYTKAKADVCRSPQNEKDCREAATQKNLQFQKSGNYNVQGCYSYKKPSKYAGKVWYGTKATGSAPTGQQMRVALCKTDTNDDLLFLEMETSSRTSSVKLGSAGSAVGLTALRLFLRYLRQGKLALDFCIGDDKRCQNNDVMRSVPGTIAVTPGDEEVQTIVAKVPKIKLGALGYVGFCVLHRVVLLSRMSSLCVCLTFLPFPMLNRLVFSPFSFFLAFSQVSSRRKS